MSAARVRGVGLHVAAFVLAATAGALIALAGQTVEIKVSDLAFLPAEVKLRIGDTVRWTNADFIDHTATAQNGDWDLALPAGGTADLTVTKAGTFDYICTVHPNMTGRIEVSGDR